MVFALGLFKPQLFFLPPLLFLCLWRPRALVGWTATAGALGAVSALLVGPEGIHRWVVLLASPFYREAVQVEQAWKMSSLSALVSAGAPAGFARPAEALGLLLGGPLVGAVVWWALRHRWGQAGGRQAASGDHEVLVWGLACLTTVLASPHLVVYDLVLLALPALLLLEHRAGREVRLALLTVFLLTWTLPVRHLLAGQLPWPTSLVGAAWTAVPVFVLWVELARLVAGGAGGRLPAALSAGRGMVGMVTTRVAARPALALPWPLRREQSR
jgi:hypothetical protein